MKLREVFRFELLYQVHHIRTWLYFAVLFIVACLVTQNSINDARNGGARANSPFVIALTTVICGLLWVLIGSGVAGSAAARDVKTRMHPLIYATPISNADYLGGRFLAALALNALILLAVPAGILLALFLPGVEPGILGPFLPAAHLLAYVVLALPTAFAVTAIQFSLAVLNRRAAVSYAGSVLLLVGVSIGAGAVINLLQMPALGKLLDPIGYVTVVGVISRTWTPLEKNTLLIGLQGSMIVNRIVWIGIGLGVLAFTHRRFRYAR
jgi:ABC-type transport system involved in multi-copper enzyme maturation permease subunit